MQKRERECLRLSECEPREMIYELGRVKLQAKMWQSGKNDRDFRGVGVCFVG